MPVSKEPNIFKCIPDEGRISYFPESDISHSAGQERDEPKEMFR
jgi:hypothetical protein